MESLKSSNGPVLWSATPTPLDENWEIDQESLAKLLQFQLALGVKGFFVSGTCGEGPWITNKQRHTLISSARKSVGPNVPLMAQVTENSAVRILENIRAAKDAGADMAVIAEVMFYLSPTEKNLLTIYSEAVEKSELPVVFYCRGKHANIPTPDSVFEKLMQHPNVVAVKDSSGDENKTRAIFAARDARPELAAFSGDENRCLEYLRKGYDGLLIGGATFNGPLVMELINSVNDAAKAEQIDEAIRALNLRIYGEGFRWWIAGLKRFMLQKGLAKTENHHLRLELPDALRAEVDAFAAGR